jgi:uncharacterized membrane protein YkvI
MHAMQVSIYLGKLEQSIEDMTDEELKEFGSLILNLAERCASSQYRSLVDSEKIAEIPVSDRESIRLLVTALAAISASAASLYLINLFKLPTNLEPLAISSSVLISAFMGYGKKAVEKISAVRGMIGQ